MAQSNEQGGDVPVGLDEAVRMFAGYVRGENGFDELDFKEWLIEWNNKQVEEVLDRLEATKRTADLCTDDTYVVKQKFIEAERVRLRGGDGK